MYLPVRKSLLCVAIASIFAGDVCAGTQSFHVNGWISSNSSFPLMGTLDIEFDDSMTNMSFSNIEVVAGVWSGDFGLVADFSSATRHPLSTLDGLQGEIRDDGTVLFQERPDGFFPPWEREEGSISVYHPFIVGTGVEGLFSADLQSMQFIKLSDFTAVDGGRSTVFLELQAVPEPCSMCLSVIAAVVGLSFVRHHRHSRV